MIHPWAPLSSKPILQRRGGHGGPPLQSSKYVLQRAFAFEQVCPQVADIRDAFAHVAQGERSWSNFAALEFVPRTGRRDWRTGLRAHRVSRRVRRAVAVAPGVDENATTAIDFAEFLREVVRIALDHNRADPVRKTRDHTKV